MKRIISLAAAALMAFAPAIGVMAKEYPHVTEKTRKVKVAEGTTIEAFSDGVLSLKDKNGKFAFYDTRTRKFLGGGKFVWSSHDGSSWGKAPYLDGAIAASRLTGPNSWDVKATFFFIHADGSTFVLPEQVVGLSPFADGICVVKREKQIGKRKVTDYIYSDELYNEVLTDFVPVDCSRELKVKGLSDGMRAVLDGESGLWGYVDESGKTVIAPMFSDAGNFSEGMALATTSTSYDKKYGIIDKTGKFIVGESMELGYGSDSPLPEFHSGYLYVPSKHKFFNAKGLEFGDGLREATCMNGNARFLANMEDEYNRSFSVTIDKELKPVPVDELFTFDYGKATEWKGGLALVKDSNGSSLLVDGNGVRILCGRKLDGSWLEESLLNAWDGEYAALMFRFSEDAQFPAYCGAKGEIVRIFCPDGEEDNAPEPEATALKGKKEYAELHVVANPPEAAKCYGSGKFERGTYRYAKAVPVSDEWEWAGWSCDDKEAQKTLDEDFGLYVNKDITIVGNFERKAKPEVPGSRRKDPEGGDKDGNDDTGGGTGWTPDPYLPAYAADVEIDNIFWKRTGSGTLPAHFYLLTDGNRGLTTAYGEKQLGIFCVTFPKGYRVTTEIGVNDKYTALPEFASVFFAPMKVEGTETVDGRTYLRLVGGLRVAGNVTESNDGAMIEGAKQWMRLKSAGKKKSYYLLNNVHDFRLEYVENADGSITLGELIMYDPTLKWVNPDSPDIPRSKAFNYGFIHGARTVEGIFGKDLFKGVVLRPAAVETVEYLPEECWFTGFPDAEKDKAAIMKHYTSEVPTYLYSKRLTFEEAMKKSSLMSLTDIFEDMSR